MHFCRSYVYLWPSRIVYSLSPGPDIICNFISLDDVSCAEATDPEGEDWNTKCDFVVNIVPKSAEEKYATTDGEDHLSSEEKLKSILPDHNLAKRSNGPQSTSFNLVRESRQRTSARINAQAADDPSKDAQLAQKPYFFRASSVSDRNNWIQHINSAVANFQSEKRRKRLEQGNFLLRNQARVRNIYTSIVFRMATAFCVGVNFLVMVRPLRAANASAVRSASLV